MLMQKLVIGLLLLSLLFLTSCGITGWTFAGQDKCKWLQGAARDDCYSQQLRCSKIESAQVRDSCVVELAKLKNNYTLCGTLIMNPKTQAYCREQLAIQQNDHLLCYDIDDFYWQDNCHSELAIRNNIYVFCSVIGNDKQRHECYLTIALAINSTQPCEGLPEKERGECIFQVARNVQDIELCLLLNHPVNRDACRLRIAKDTHDSSICETMDTTMVQDACREYFLGE